MDELIHYAADGVVLFRLVNGNMQVVEVNTAFQLLLGYSSKRELLGLELRELGAFDCESEMASQIERLRKVKSIIIEAVYRRKNQTHVNVELSMRLFYKEGHMYIVSIVRDISERKWIEAQMAEPHLIASGRLNEQLIIEQISIYKRDTNFTQKDFQYRSIVHMVASEDVMKMRKLYKQSALDGLSREFIMWTMVKNGKKKQRSRICPFYKPDGTLNKFAFVLMALPETDEGDMPPCVKLKLLMLKHKVSLIQLADRTGISKTTLSKLRNGKIRKPHAYTQRLVARALDVEETDIWEDKNSIQTIEPSKERITP